MSGRFEGKVAIVTGAGAGYGQGIASKLSQEGASVIIVDLSEANGNKVASELNNAIFIHADITNHTSWESILNTTITKFGHIDIIVNNAGVCYDKRDTETVPEQTFDLMMNVNVKAIYHSTTVIIPFLLKQDTPAVFINVASTSAVRPRPGTTWYNASKAAVVAATSTMAIEYASRKIRFNTVCPVVGRTSMTDSLLSDETMYNTYAASIPMGRMCTPRDVANAVAYLASDDADFITGVHLSVDGGRCV